MAVDGPENDDVPVNSVGCQVLGGRYPIANEIYDAEMAAVALHGSHGELVQCCSNPLHCRLGQLFGTCAA